MRAFILLLSVCISTSVFAGPPKGRNGKPKKAKPAAVAAAPAAAKVEIPAGIVDPEFRHEFAKADPFIQAIIQEHERQFPGAMSYRRLNFYAQLNRLSYIQQGLVFELMQTPGYIEAFTGREPMTDLKVTVAEGEEIEVKKHDERLWKAYLDYILAHVEFAEKELKGKKQPVTAASVFERLKKSFYRAWNAAYYPTESDDVQTRLIPFLVYGTLLKRNPDASQTDIKKSISELDIGALDYFQDKHSWEPVFEGIQAKIEWEKKDFPADLEQAMDRTHRQLLKKMYGLKEQKITLKKGDVITIREVHPDIAMFRGYVGNDCATCFSPGFVFNPMDRYYYAYDSQGNVLGYVGTTFVKVKDKKATLIHTIQGPGFNQGTTQMVMRAFQSIQATFGSELTVLSSDDNIFSNMNYYPIQDAMMQAVRGHKELPLKFDDVEFRKIIGKWDSEMTYDSPDRHRYGRQLTFNDKEVIVEVTQKPFDFTMSMSSQEAIDAAKKECSLRMSGYRSRGGGDYSDWGGW